MSLHGKGRSTGGGLILRRMEKNMKIRIVKAHEGKWYKVGEVYTVLDLDRYSGIGVQVVKPGNGHTPDVVADEDYEFIDGSETKSV